MQQTINGKSVELKPLRNGFLRRRWDAITALAGDPQRDSGVILEAFNESSRGTLTEADYNEMSPGETTALLKEIMRISFLTEKPAGEPASP